MDHKVEGPQKKRKKTPHGQHSNKICVDQGQSGSGSTHGPICVHRSQVKINRVRPSPR